MHLALVGDSTLDNGAYTGTGPAVIEWPRSYLSEDGGERETKLVKEVIG